MEWRGERREAVIEQYKPPSPGDRKEADEQNEQSFRECGTGLKSWTSASLGQKGRKERDAEETL